MGSSILLISIVLLLNSPVGFCGCFKRIFSFGDSIINTSNFVRMELPYGMTYFNRPTSRVSDGRVIIDFYGENPHKGRSRTIQHGAEIALDLLGYTLLVSELPILLLELLRGILLGPFELGLQVLGFEAILLGMVDGVRPLVGKILLVVGNVVRHGHLGEVQSGGVDLLMGIDVSVVACCLSINWRL
uniref:Uncharacterized protein n=1 Tax=Setaria viridis TaxID=4556 RepID=A0A4U6UHP8_SETVI|nr:hypothetical protein SEVIR_5G253500v2 [Setaria viridis]